MLQPQDLRSGLRILPSLPVVRLEDRERGRPRPLGVSRELAVALRMKSAFPVMAP